VLFVYDDKALLRSATSRFFNALMLAERQNFIQGDGRTFTVSSIAPRLARRARLSRKLPCADERGS
jgi:hypothetical protein